MSINQDVEVINKPMTELLTTDLTKLKLALLADWQYLCHDDFDEETEMDEDQYWQYLESKSTAEINRMIEEDFDAERTPEMVINLYLTYLSPKYQDMMEPVQ